MYVEINKDLEKAIKGACKSQIITNDFMILCELYKLGEIPQTKFKKRLKEIGINF